MGAPSSLGVVRTSGPLVSSITASESDASRVLATMRAMPASSRCAELTRTTFIPAAASERRNSTSHRLSEIVAIILVNLFITQQLKHTKKTVGSGD